MLLYEMKANFKSFLIWLTVLILIFLTVFLVYPSIINSENVEMMNELMKVFPPEILKAFNMDIASVDSAYGWLKSEGYVFVLLIIGCYSGILGSNVLLKEENDKTIEYLNSLPVKRTNIVLSKVAISLIYISSMIVALGIFNFLGLLLSGDFDKKQYILISITPFFSCFVIFFICMFISTFTHKNRKMLGFSLGIVLISYFLQMLSQIAENVEFFKYLSVFTLSDIRNVILESSINIWMIVISAFISCFFLILILFRYNRKELV